MRKVGDRVFIVADNAPIGSGVITAVREGPYPYQVRTDDGKETWYAEFEVFDPDPPERGLRASVGCAGVPGHPAMLSKRRCM